MHVTPKQPAEEPKAEQKTDEVGKAEDEVI